MDTENDINTVGLLMARLDSLKDEFDNIIEKRNFLQSEILKVENALKAILPKGGTAYNQEWSLEQKISHCLKHRRKMMCSADIVDYLFHIDKALYSDLLDANRSIRFQIGKMVTQNLLVQYKPSKFRFIHYALKEWTDDIGEIKERYFF